ncbi:MAG: translation elongation factor Ts [Lachnospiraceae bacterium]|jgi:elongation factor Ts|nr:translation elongation factor Ts [Lachnospiraceae bacterium]
MNISAGMVKDLRELSGAGMMDCKNALMECDGDMEAAMDYLRKKGQAKAEKRAGRIAAEGLCLVVQKSSTVAALAEVNSETDFVAKNDEFRSFVTNVAEHAAGSEALDVETLLAEKWNFAADGSGGTIGESLVSMIAKIGENMSVRRFAKVTATEGFVATYVHGGGKIGVIIEAKADVENDAVREAFVNLAMQVAAMSPLHVSSDEIPQSYIDKEKEILMAQAVEENQGLAAEKQKPEHLLEKIVAGQLNKQMKEICLLDQVYVKADGGKQTVSQYLAEVAKACSASLSIKQFVRYETGEGLEKREEDFAAEVAKQMG